MNADKLRSKITERGLTVNKVSLMIGIDKSTLYRKLNNYEKMTIGDALNLKDALELSDFEAFEIFLS